LWNDHNATDEAKVTNLCKGNYKVEILDNRDCATESTVSINDTLNFTFNIPDSTIICPGKALTLDAGYSGSQYSWNYENTNYSNSQTVSLTQDGDYSVTVTTPEGCYGTKEFYLRTSIDALQANFLIPSFV